MDDDSSQSFSDISISSFDSSYDDECEKDKDNDKDKRISKSEEKKKSIAAYNMIHSRRKGKTDIGIFDSFVPCVKKNPKSFPCHNCGMKMERVKSFFISVRFCIGVYSIFSYSNIEKMHINEEIMILSYIEKYSISWLSQGKLLTQSAHDFLRVNEDELDLTFSDNMTKGRDTIEKFQKFQIMTLRSANKVGYMGFGKPNGVLLIAGVDPVLGEHLVKRNYTNVDYNETVDGLQGIGWETTLNENYTFSPYIAKYSNFDFMKSPTITWYRDRVNPDNNDKALVWSEFVKISGELGTACTKKWFDSKGTFQGVLSVFFSLSVFDSFLKHDLIQVIGKGSVFLIELNEELLLSCSMDNETEPPTFYFDDEGNIKRVKSDSSSCFIIRETTLMLKKMYKNLRNITSMKKPVTFTDSNGVKRIAMAKKINVDGYSILAVHVSDYKDIYKKVLKANVVALFVSLSFAMIFVVIVYCIVICIFKPFLVLIEEMGKVQKMDLNSIKIKKSNLFELSEVQKNFVYMITKLKEFRSFLPSSVMEQNTSNKNDIFNSRRSSLCSEISSLSSVGSESSLNEEDVFTFGVKENFFIFATIFFNFTSRKVRRNKESVKEFISSFYNIARRCVRKHNGHVFDYRFDRIICKFINPVDCCVFAISFIKVTSNIIQQEKEIGNEISIIVHNAKCFHGTVGNDDIKKRILWGPEFDCLEKINDTMKMKRCTSDSIIFITEEIEKNLSSSFIRKPVEILQSCNKDEGKLFFLYHLKEFIDPKKTIMNNKLNNELVGKYVYFNEFLKYLKRGDTANADVYLKMYLNIDENKDDIEANKFMKLMLLLKGNDVYEYAGIPSNKQTMSILDRIEQITSKDEVEMNYVFKSLRDVSTQTDFTENLYLK